MPEVQLETRVCQCGCGGRFRVLSTSPQVTASAECRPPQVGSPWHRDHATFVPQSRLRPELVRPKEELMPKATPDPVGDLLDINQLARALGVSVATLNVWKSRGRIPAAAGNRGRALLYSLKATQAQLRTTEPTTPAQLVAQTPRKPQEPPKLSLAPNPPPTPPDAVPEPRTEALDTAWKQIARQTRRAFRDAAIAQALDAERRGDPHTAVRLLIDLLSVEPKLATLLPTLTARS